MWRDSRACGHDAHVGTAAPGCPAAQKYRAAVAGSIASDPCKERKDGPPRIYAGVKGCATRRVSSSSEKAIAPCQDLDNPQLAVMVHRMFYSALGLRDSETITQS